MDARERSRRHQLLQGLQQRNQANRNVFSGQFPTTASTRCQIIDVEAHSIEESPVSVGRRLRSRRKLLKHGAIALFLLSGLIWSIAQLGILPPLVGAQEAQPRSTASPAQVWRGASFPVENFQAYTSPFGYRIHPLGGTSFHYGLDIAAPLGSYIRAWWGGTLVEVSDDTACGTSVVIQTSDYLHIYCHMQGYVVVEKDGDRWLVDREGGIQLRQGDTVATGQRIGRVGMTGRTTGPHLHWGIKYQGNWLDPSVVVRAMTESSG
jgi:murein DD-endopeptidase MepM/ murein hydrolase activator NlpD